MDLAAALATIEDARPRRTLLAVVVAALVVVAIGHDSRGVAVVAILAAWAVAGVIVHRHHQADAERDRRVGDAVAAWLQVEHDLLVAGPVEVRRGGARAVALELDGIARTVEVRWDELSRRTATTPVAITGPVQLYVSELVAA